MNLIYIIVNFNNAIISIRCVNSILYDQKLEGSRKIIVVDNFSLLNDIEILESKLKIYEEVVIIRSIKNVGYFGGLNLGLEYIHRNKLKFDLIILGNNDLIFPANFSFSLLSTSEFSNKFPVIAPNILTTKGDHKNPHVINRISLLRNFILRLYYLNYNLSKVLMFFSNFIFLLKRRDVLSHSMSMEILMGHGSCFILTPLFFQHYSFLPCNTFMYNEEVFLAQVIKKINLKIFYLNTILVYHDEHSTVMYLDSRELWKMKKNSFKKAKHLLFFLK